MAGGDVCVGEVEGQTGVISAWCVVGFVDGVHREGGRGKGRCENVFFFLFFFVIRMLTHLLDATSAHTLTSPGFQGVLLVDVLHRALDVSVRFESLAVLKLLPLLHRV